MSMPDHLRKWNKPKVAQQKNKMYNLHLAEMLGTTSAALAALDKVTEQLYLLQVNHEVRTAKPGKLNWKIKEDVAKLRAQLTALFGDVS